MFICRITVWVVVLAVGVLAGSPAWASQVQELKWIQLPDLSANGYDFSSERLAPSVVADDFQCNDTRPITDIHWWGSYYKTSDNSMDKNSDHHGDPSFTTVGQPPTMPPVVTAFSISIYADVPALRSQEMPYSHPGTLLYSDQIPIASVASSIYGTIDRNDNGTYGDDGDEAVWMYSLNLRTPFVQVPGTIYWLSIVAHNDDEANPANIQWGWHESSSHWNDSAVQSGPPGIWGDDYSVDWANLELKDMAFELSVPEPVTTALVGGGLAIMALSRRRRK